MCVRSFVCVRSDFNRACQRWLVKRRRDLTTGCYFESWHARGARANASAHVQAMHACMRADMFVCLCVAMLASTIYDALHKKHSDMRRSTAVECTYAHPQRTHPFGALGRMRAPRVIRPPNACASGPSVRQGDVTLAPHEANSNTPQISVALLRGPKRVSHRHPSDARSPPARLSGFPACACIHSD